MTKAPLEWSALEVEGSDVVAWELRRDSTVMATARRGRYAGRWRWIWTADGPGIPPRTSTPVTEKIALIAALRYVREHERPTRT